MVEVLAASALRSILLGAVVACVVAIVLILEERWRRDWNRDRYADRAAIVYLTSGTPTGHGPGYLGETQWSERPDKEALAKAIAKFIPRTPTEAVEIRYTMQLLQSGGYKLTAHRVAS